MFRTRVFFFLTRSNARKTMEAVNAAAPVLISTSVAAEISWLMDSDFDDRTGAVDVPEGKALEEAVWTAVADEALSRSFG